MPLRLQFGSRLRFRKSRNAGIVQPVLEVFNQLPINTFLSLTHLFHSLLFIGILPLHLLLALRHHFLFAQIVKLVLSIKLVYRSQIDRTLTETTLL